MSGIMSACTATTHGQMDDMACQKAAQAGSIQLGIQQQVDSFEEREVKYLNRKAEQWVGKEGVYAVSGTYFIARTVQTKSLLVGIPNMGLADSIKADIGPSQSILRIEWNF